ncbi:MAG: hypothetical protein D4R84_09755 [Rhodocyclaceae bacterium]|nr:MAG: hypothetical protein D4R84_09755 [Rhodocyclaceae bacterium]
MHFQEKCKRDTVQLQFMVNVDKVRYHMPTTRAAIVAKDHVTFKCAFVLESQQLFDPVSWRILDWCGWRRAHKDADNTL